MIHPNIEFLSGSLTRKTILSTYVMFAFSGEAVALEVSCPETISVHQQLTKAPEGWQENGIKQREHMFADMSFGALYKNLKDGHSYDSPFREDDEIVKDHMANSIWLLEEENKYNYAVFCTYISTDITVTKLLPKGLKRCEITSKIDEANQYHFVKAECF